MSGPNETGNVVVSFTDELKVVERFRPDGKLWKREHFNEQGLHHNPNGPALENWWPNGQKKVELFCLIGRIHNRLGPAETLWNENGDLDFQQFFIDDELVTEEEFVARTSTKSAGKR